MISYFSNSFKTYNFKNIATFNMNIYKVKINNYLIIHTVASLRAKECFIIIKTRFIYVSFLFYYHFNEKNYDNLN